MSFHKEIRLGDNLNYRGVCGREGVKRESEGKGEGGVRQAYLCRLRSLYLTYLEQGRLHYEAVVVMVDEIGNTVGSSPRLPTPSSPGLQSRRSDAGINDGVFAL